MVKPRRKGGKPVNKKVVEPSDVEVAKKLLNIYQSAADRKLEFNLSFESVKTLLKFQTCYYTGRKFDNEGPYARSIDRIDSGKGYIEGNVVSCTVDINGKKSNLSDDEIELLYNKIVLHKKKAVEEPAEMEILTPDGSYIPEEGTELISEEFGEYETQFSTEGAGLDQDQEDARP
jgi:hypothetical protein